VDSFCELADALEPYIVDVDARRGMPQDLIADTVLALDRAAKIEEAAREVLLYAGHGEDQLREQTMDALNAALTPAPERKTRE
jgi:hypothetical protein